MRDSNLELPPALFHVCSTWRVFQESYLRIFIEQKANILNQLPRANLNVTELTPCQQQLLNDEFGRELPFVLSTTVMDDLRGLETLPSGLSWALGDQPQLLFWMWYA